MTEWELLLKEGRSIDEQIDEVGNIYQKSGGVVPKACQKCKKEFTAKIKSTPITQDIPLYICSCNYETGDPTEAFDHKLLTSHSIKRTVKSRIVTNVNILEGQKANIKEIYTDDKVSDVIILCDACFSKK